MNISIPTPLRGLFISVTTLVIFFLVYLGVNTLLMKTTSEARSFKLEALVLTSQGKFDRANNDYASAIKKFDSPFIVNGTPLNISSLSAFIAPQTIDLTDLTAAIEAKDSAAASTAFKPILSVIDATVQRKEKLVFTLQIVVAMLVVVIYLAVIFQMFRKAGNVEATSRQSKQEAEGIMNTISEGLFLMKSDFEIGIEQSASLKEMFRSERDLEGDFFTFISDYVTPSTVQIARDFIELLFGDRVKEKLITDLNPLNEVEINILRRDGGYENRYLNFSFKRVMDGKSLSHLLCSVTDITREVELARQLEDAQEEQEAQLDLLMSVLHVDPSQLRRFFVTADEALNEMNATLEQHSAIHEKEKHSDRAIRGKLNDIAVMAHKLKGDAAILELKKFEFATHDLEEELGTLKETREALDGKSLLPLVGKLRELFSELENMRGLVEKFASVVSTETDKQIEKTQVLIAEDEEPSTASEMTLDDAIPKALSDVPATPEPENLAAQLQQLASTAAARQGKDINLRIMADDMPEPGDIYTTLKDVAIQLIRNSIVHGIETPEQRLKLNKTNPGNIACKVERTDSGYKLKVADDGAGLNYEAIAQRAKNNGLLGSTQTIDERTALNLIFKPGFSSRDDADLDGGRGVGLDVVMRSVKKLGGKVGMKQTPGKQCQFSVSIPA